MPVGEVRWTLRRNVKVEGAATLRMSEGWVGGGSSRNNYEWNMKYPSEYQLIKHAQFI